MNRGEGMGEGRTVSACEPCLGTSALRPLCAEPARGRGDPHSCPRCRVSRLPSVLHLYSSSHSGFLVGRGGGETKFTHVFLECGDIHKITKLILVKQKFFYVKKKHSTLFENY